MENTGSRDAGETKHGLETTMTSFRMSMFVAVVFALLSSSTVAAIDAGHGHLVAARGSAEDQALGQQVLAAAGVPPVHHFTIIPNQTVPVMKAFRKHIIFFL